MPRVESQYVASRRGLTSVFVSYMIYTEDDETSTKQERTENKQDSPRRLKMKKTEEQITQEIIFAELGSDDRFQYGSAKGKPRCSKTVSGSRWRGSRCSKTATCMEPDPWAEKDDPLRPFCKIHAPSRVGARYEEKRVKGETAFKARQARHAECKREFVSRMVEVGQLKGKRFRTEAARLVNDIICAGMSWSRM